MSFQSFPGGLLQQARYRSLSSDGRLVLFTVSLRAGAVGIRGEAHRDVVLAQVGHDTALPADRAARAFDELVAANWLMCDGGVMWLPGHLTDFSCLSPTNATHRAMVRKAFADLAQSDSAVVAAFAARHRDDWPLGEATAPTTAPTTGRTTARPTAPRTARPTAALVVPFTDVDVDAKKTSTVPATGTASDRNGDATLARDDVPAPAPAYPPEFERLWRAYPRRSGPADKKGALRAWRATRKRGATADEMHAGAERYAAYCTAARVDPRYVKLCATFLGPDEHWREEYAVPTAGADLVELPDDFGVLRLVPRAVGAAP